MTNTTPSWDDAQLMAWADGLLPPDEAAALEAAIEHDAALAHRAALMLPTRALVREAYDAQLAAEPVPAALHDAVQAMVAQDRARRAQAQAAQAGHATQAAQPEHTAQAAQATPRAEHAESPTPAPAAQPTQGRATPAGRPRTAATTGWRETLARLFTGFALPGAIAASVVFAGLGFLIGQSAAPAPAAGNTLAAGAPAPAALAALLDRLPSGEEARLDGAALGMVASFRDAQGRVCRDFSLAQPDAARLESVACRAPGGVWRIDYAALAPSDSAAYTPAGAGSALDAYLAAIGAGQPLDAQAERALLRKE